MEKYCVNLLIEIKIALNLHLDFRQVLDHLHKMKNLIDLVEAPYRRDDHPEFQAGDTIEVRVRIKEGDKERVQLYKGVVIQRRGSGANATFTVRKMSGTIGVERIFPISSPNIESIKVAKRGIVRRAKIFYLRERSGKSARIKERR